MIKTLEEDAKDRLVELEGYLAEAEKHPKNNKLYISDLKLSIKQCRRMAGYGEDKSV